MEANVSTEFLNIANQQIIDRHPDTETFTHTQSYVRTHT